MRLSNFSFLVGSLATLLLVYHNSFDHSFHYDDFHSIVENPHIRNLSNIGAFFYQPELFSSMPERAMFRPLVLASYAFNYRLGKYAVWGYHLVNFPLHFLCVFCVFLLGRALGKAQWTAALGAGLFALYPLQAEVVNYISSRSESLATLFYLTSLLTYLHWRQRGEKEWFFLALSLGAFVCALLSKSIAITLPAALLLGEWVWGHEPGKGHRWREIAPYHLAYWVLALGFVAVVSRGIQSAVGDPVRSLHLHFLIQIKAAIYYLYLGEMPVYLSVEHAFEVARTAWSAEVLLPLGLGLSILILLFAPAQERRGALVLLGSTGSATGFPGTAERAGQRTPPLLTAGISEPGGGIVRPSAGPFSEVCLCGTAGHLRRPSAAARRRLARRIEPVDRRGGQSAF